MKCVQVLRSSGSEDDRVSSYRGQRRLCYSRTVEHTLTSVVEMLPTTLKWLSTTAIDETPSLFMT